MNYLVGILTKESYMLHIQIEGCFSCTADLILDVYDLGTRADDDDSCKSQSLSSIFDSMNFHQVNGKMADRSLSRPKCLILSKVKLEVDKMLIEKLNSMLDLLSSSETAVISINRRLKRTNT